MQYAAWLLEDDAPGAVVQWSGSSAEVDVKCGGNLLLRLAQPSSLDYRAESALTAALGGIRRI